MIERRADLRGLLPSLLLLLAPGTALAVEEDVGLWATLSGDGRLAGPPRAGLMLQARFTDDIGELERLVVRPFVSLELLEGFSSSIGYDAHWIDQPDHSVEQRIWQQIAGPIPVGPLPLDHRLRLEERFLEGVPGTPLRLRYLLGATHPIGSSGFAAVARNEVFANLNTVRGGVRAGFGEDRAFAGVRRALPGPLSMEIGYQLRYVDRPGRDLAQHLLMVGLQVSSP